MVAGSYTTSSGRLISFGRVLPRATSSFFLSVSVSKSLCSLMDATILLIKDHDHLRRTRNGFCDISIHPDIKSLIQREKFLASTSNTAQLILLLAETFSKNVISVQQCHDDADTAIFRAALDEVKKFFF